MNPAERAAYDEGYADGYRDAREELLDELEDDEREWEPDPNRRPIVDVIESL